MQDETIIIFPEYDRLKKDIEKLRTELSMLMAEYDELRLVECKNIEMQYMLLLGGLEYRAYELECTYLRLKRKIELIQVKINRQEKVVIASIELTLDVEFSEYKEKLNEQIDRMNEALERSKYKVLSNKESDELKSLYRKVVKELHPDLHPDVTESQIELLCNATEAYENGDITRMRIIAEMVATDDLPYDRADSIVKLVSEKERLAAMIDDINAKIVNLKSDYPYILKDIVCNDDKSNQRKKELEDIIGQYTEAITILNDKIAELERESYE